MVLRLFSLPWNVTQRNYGDVMKKNLAEVARSRRGSFTAVHLEHAYLVHQRTEQLTFHSFTAFGALHLSTMYIIIYLFPV